MYNISDVIEMGEAHDLVLSDIKEEFIIDDAEPHSMPVEEYFDE